MKRLALFLLLAPMAVAVGVLLLVERLDKPEHLAGGVWWRNDG